MEQLNTKIQNLSGSDHEKKNDDDHFFTFIFLIYNLG